MRFGYPVFLPGGGGIARATIMQALLWIDPYARRQRDHANTRLCRFILLILDRFRSGVEVLVEPYDSGMILMTRSVTSLESNLEPENYVLFNMAQFGFRQGAI